jgi:hypothetical protein
MKAIAVIIIGIIIDNTNFFIGVLLLYRIISFIFLFSFRAIIFRIPNSVGMSPKIIANINDKSTLKFIPNIGLEKTNVITNITIPGAKTIKIFLELIIFVQPSFLDYTSKSP